MAHGVCTTICQGATPAFEHSETHPTAINGQSAFYSVPYHPVCACVGGGRGSRGHILKSALT